VLDEVASHIDSPTKSTVIVWFALSGSLMFAARLRFPQATYPLSHALNFSTF
jgi:hypothetical protein